jgi:hypothetical protein
MEAPVVPAAAAGAPPPPPPPGAAVAVVQKRAPPTQWNTVNEENVIDEWGGEFTRLQQGNLANRHWKRIADAVNEKRGDCPEYTVKQCQTKIDSLKTKYKEELKKKTSTGNVNSTWVHFERMGEFLEKLPKTIGIPNGRDSSGVVNSASESVTAPGGVDPCGVEHPDFEPQQHLADEHAEAPDSLVTPEKRSASKLEKVEESTPPVHTSGPGGSKSDPVSLSPASEVLAKNEKLGVSGQRVKPPKRKRDSGDDTMKPVAAAMDRFGAVYAQVATSMMQIQKDIATDKANRAKEMADEKAKRDKEIADAKAANALALKEMELRLMMAWKANQGPNPGPN